MMAAARAAASRRQAVFVVGENARLGKTFNYQWWALCVTNNKPNVRTIFE